MNEATQTGVAMAAIATISTVAGLVIGWLRDRDKLQYDQRLSSQDAQIGVLTRQNEAQAREMGELKTEIASCQQKHEAERTAKHELRDQLHTIQLKVQLMEDRAKLRHGDDAADHRPPA